MPENDNKKELDSSITAWFDSLLTELGNGKKINPEDEEDRKRTSYYEIVYGRIKNSKKSIPFEDVFSNDKKVKNNAIKSLYEEAKDENLYIYNKADKTLRRAFIGEDGKIKLSEDIGSMTPPQKPGKGFLAWFASKEEKERYKHDYDLYMKENMYFGTKYNKYYGDIKERREEAIAKEKNKSKEDKKIEKIEEQTKKLDEKKKELEKKKEEIEKEKQNREPENDLKFSQGLQEKMLFDYMANGYGNEKNRSEEKVSGENNVKNAEGREPAEEKISGENNVKASEVKEPAEEKVSGENNVKISEVKESDKKNQVIEQSKKVSLENLSDLDLREMKESIDKSEEFIKKAVGAKKEEIPVNKLINAIADKDFKLEKNLKNSDKALSTNPTLDNINKAVDKLFVMVDSENGLSKETVFAGVFAKSILESYNEKDKKSVKLSDTTIRKLKGIVEIGKIASAGFEAREKLNNAVDIGKLENRDEIIKNYITAETADFSLRMKKKIENGKTESGVMAFLKGGTDAEGLKTFIAGRNAYKQMAGSPEKIKSFVTSNKSQRSLNIANLYKDVISDFTTKTNVKIKNKERLNVKSKPELQNKNL